MKQPDYNLFSKVEIIPEPAENNPQNPAHLFSGFDVCRTTQKHLKIFKFIANK